jgi:hypothetical protein
MRNVSDKNCRETENTLSFCNEFFSPTNRAVYEKMWEKYGTAGQAEVDNIIWRMRFACQITETRPQTCTQNV